MKRVRAEAIGAEHFDMHNTRTRPEQGFDEYICTIDNCRDRLNACDTPEGPICRQYEDLFLQALPSEFKAIRQSHIVAVTSQLPILGV